MRTRSVDYKEVEGCFVCTSHAPNGLGYPKLMKNGKNILLKDYVYEQTVTPIKENEEIVLTCGNRECINIAHMSKIPKRPDHKGERNSRSILKESQVVEIKHMLRANIYTKIEIAKMYNVSPSAIYNILYKHTWSHVK